MKILLIYTDENVFDLVKRVSALRDLEAYRIDDLPNIDFTQFALVIVNLSSEQCDAILDKVSSAVPVFRVKGEESFIHRIKRISNGLVSSVSLPVSADHLDALIDRFALVDLDSQSEELVTFVGDDTSVTIPICKKNMLNYFEVGSHNYENQSHFIQESISSSHENQQVSLHVSEEFVSLRKTEQDVLNGLENGEFQVSYQPVHSIESGDLVGYEALIRWEKGGEYISPEIFIPEIERSDGIFHLSRWVVDSVLHDIVELNTLFQFNGDLRININLSARLFEIPNFASEIADKTKSFGVDPDQIGLEITESAFMSSKEIANLSLLKFKAEKYHIYLDDFGTGYSSLAYLQYFPIGVLKIDKSFVKWLTFDDDSDHIVKSIIGLAHGLNMKVVGEGVEEQEQVDFLRECGCEYGQGFFYSRALFFNDVVEYCGKYFKRV